LIPVWGSKFFFPLYFGLAQSVHQTGVRFHGLQVVVAVPLAAPLGHSWFSTWLDAKPAFVYASNSQKWLTVPPPRQISSPAAALCSGQESSAVVTKLFTYSSAQPVKAASLCSAGRRTVRSWIRRPRSTSTQEIRAVWSRHSAIVPAAPSKHRKASR
jgi:hypothetical protein